MPPHEVDAAPAPGWRSALAHFVDLLVPLAFGVLVAKIEAWITPGIWRGHGVTMLDTVAEWTHAHSGAAAHGVVGAVLAGFAYHLVSVRWQGRTLGRRLAGIYLVRKSGSLPRWPLLLARTALSLVSIACFGAGYFWSIVDRHRRTWHDLLTGTLLVTVAPHARPRGRA
ncbi:MAG: RDD family protein [Deltaproteobacteria bacterium]|nr:RDD family protein [Deltaproteobacteria bacterium]